VFALNTGWPVVWIRLSAAIIERIDGVAAVRNSLPAILPTKDRIVVYANQESRTCRGMFYEIGVRSIKVTLLLPLSDEIASLHVSTVSGTLCRTSLQSDGSDRH
jgi:hypothetical protein